MEPSNFSKCDMEIDAKLSVNPEVEFIQYLSNPETVNFNEIEKESVVGRLIAERPDLEELVNLFAYGTYADLKNAKSVDQNIVRKLRKLSLITYATEEKEISYSKILKELELDTVRELEDLVIESIYESLIKARLDSKRQVVQITDWSARDTKADALPSMLELLSSWMKKAHEVEENSFKFCAEEDKKIEKAYHQSIDAEKQVQDLTSLLDMYHRREVSNDRNLAAGREPAFASSSNTPREVLQKPKTTRN